MVVLLGAETPSSRNARLQGLNLAGGRFDSATPESMRRLAGDATLARLASWRFSHVRLPLDAGLLAGSSPQANHASWAALDGVLAACERYRLRCVLAWRIDQANLFAEEAGWRALIKQWEAVASRYCDWPDSVYFDLLDRPSAPDALPPEALSALGAARLSPVAARRPASPGATGGRAWNALALRLTQAIRAIDARHTIVVESNEGASAAAFTHLRPTRDQNTIYSFHCFEPVAFTQQGTAATAPASAGESAVVYPGMIGGERWDRERLQQLFQPALEFHRVYEVPLYLGAFGASAAAPRQGRLTWVRSLLSLCRMHALGWAYWTYEGDPCALMSDSGAHGVPELDHHPQRPQRPQRLDYDLLGILQSEA